MGKINPIKVFTGENITLSQYSQYNNTTCVFDFTYIHDQLYTDVNTPSLPHLQPPLEL